MSWRNIFKDNNTWNEKTIVGAISFVVMIMFAVVDLIVKDLVINDLIYNSFVIVTLGAFGIAEVGKVFSKNKN
jgi:hypothetical protein|tara:strand:- start:1401 stop:1619 length:219 start_codon:yes stop_codon:yes gene_type:complete